jgi:hypothetical protein
MAKGSKTGGGTRKGKPNKLTADLRSAIQEAFVNAGGVTYLTKVAEESPAVFCKLLGMTLPKDIKVEATGSLTIQVVTGVPEA